ncbi:M1 family aminopeptidase [Microbulbifer sp. CnH-101-G]|uniref:M1 family aminopeptidase n=1 Tax=Microbulbifer sp. CnH-101-G TaxID=3243393 RepID=UPI004038FEA9
MGIIPLNSSYELVIGSETASEVMVASRLCIEVEQLTDRITLNAIDLKISSLKVEDNNGKKIPFALSQYNEKNKIELIFKNTVAPSTLTISAKYLALIKSDQTGLYKVNYGAATYFFTRLQPNYASKLFLSMADIGYKPEVNIKVTCPKNLNVISNTIQLSETKVTKTLKKVSFENIINVPLYGIALAIGEFDIVEGESVEGNFWRRDAINIRGITPKGLGQKIQFALENTQKYIHFFESLLHRGYSYKKLDLIAVPEFIPSGMENPGAIFYSSSLILLDNLTHLKEKFLSVHAHEIAHQWFGNAVSIINWEDIWINEGCATWLSREAMESLNPCFVSDKLHMEETFRVINHDSSISAQSISKKIENELDIESAFNRLSYDKIALLLNIFSNQYGKDKIIDVLRRVIQNSYFYCKQDFYSALENIIDRKAKSIFKSYIEQPGIPLVEVSSYCKSGNAYLKIKQLRYINGSPDCNNYHWPIEIKIKEKKYRSNFRIDFTDGKEINYFLEGKQKKFEFTPNLEQDCYVLYPLGYEAWKTLLYSRPNIKNIPLALVNIIISLKTGKTTANQFLGLLKLFTSLYPASIAFIADELRFFKYNLFNNTQNNNLRKILKYSLRFAIEKHDKKLSVFSNSDNDEFLLESEIKLIQVLALDFGDRWVRDELLGIEYELFELTNYDNFNQNQKRLASTALGILAQKNINKMTEKLITDLQYVKDDTQRVIYLQALANVRCDKFSIQIHNLIISPKIKLNEKAVLLLNYTLYPDNTKRLLYWSENNWGKIKKILPSIYIPYFINLFENLNSLECYDKISKLFKTEVDSIAGGEYYLTKTLNKIKSSIEFAERHKIVMPIDN